MKRILRSRVWVVAVAAVALPAWAHHSTAAYDYSKAVTLQGTVTAFQWTNPHMFIDLAVTDAQGQRVVWTIECGTPNINVRHGWKESDVKPGDKVAVKIHPMHNTRESAGTLMTLMLADGRTLYGPGNDIVDGKDGPGGATGSAVAPPPQ